MTGQTENWLIQITGMTIDLISDMNHCDCVFGPAHDYNLVPHESEVILNYHNLNWTDFDAPRKWPEECSGG